MLKHLTIKNYALIQELSISPSDNLNIITGETGAGKSIMLGAVGLLLGNRADTKALLHAETKCVIEGQFDISQYNLESIFKKEDLDYEPLTIIRREISPSGKSRAFVNDSPVNLDILKKLGVKLIDVHSQHETLQLGKNAFQLKFIDVFAGCLPLRNTYYQTFQAYKKALNSLNSLKSEEENAKKESDYNKFLLDELINLNLKSGEQEELEQSIRLMENAEDIKIKLNQSLDLLNNSDFAITNGIQQLRTILNQMAKYSENYASLLERIESSFLEITDIANEVEKEEEKINFNPEEALQSQERLSQIYQLQQKHNVQTIESLLLIQQELDEKAEHSLNIGDKIKVLETEVTQLHYNTQKLAKELSLKRSICFDKLTKELVTLLKEVGIGDANIKIEIKEIELESSGKDEVSILFSANKGIAPQELVKVASGGEFSRLMFCIKYILANKVALPTVIFDEIDTGVSGEIAIKLGGLMKKMAEKHQLITITHLPQIAAKGDQHYYVYKDNSSNTAMSKIKELNTENRIIEIAKMIGGDSPSPVSFESAKELMQSS
jgi:DNA repair protein RecN (Recombination protein N)